MHKKILALVTTLLMLGALAGCGESGSGASSATASASVSSEASASAETASVSSEASASASDSALADTFLQDLVSESTIYQIDDQEWGVEYAVIYAGEGTGALTKYQDVIQFYKSVGYGQEDLENYDLDSVIPGFSSLSFVWAEVEEKHTVAHGDIVQITITFDDLKNRDNLLALDNAGILMLDNRDADYVIASSLCLLFEEQGAKEIEPSEREELGLPLI